MSSLTDPAQPIHPVWLRLMHWVNAFAVVILVMSGWLIYNASPFFGISFPAAMTLGGWLGGAIQWHFAAMWLLAANGLTYLLCNALSGRLRSRFLPLSFRAVLADFRLAMRGRLTHDDPGRYNAVQRMAYLLVLLDAALLIMSGLVLWKSVQLPLLRELLGDYEVARRVHFIAMAVMVGFALIHVTMVALVPRSLLTMIRGR